MAGKRADVASSESSPAADIGTLGVVGTIAGASIDASFCNFGGDFGDDLNVGVWRRDVGVDIGVGVADSTSVS